MQDSQISHEEDAHEFSPSLVAISMPFLRMTLSEFTFPILFSFSFKGFGILVVYLDMQRNNVSNNNYCVLFHRYISVKERFLSISGDVCEICR